MEKIYFNLEKSELHDHTTESLWCEKKMDSVYVIKNVPFYAFGIAYDDEVVGHFQNGLLFFQSINKRSGHSTYRLIVYDGVTESTFLRYWAPLREMGCTYEKGADNLFAIDVPPETNIHRVFDQLTAGEQDEIWGFEEGFCPLNQ